VREPKGRRRSELPEGRVFSHPDIGDLGYSFSANAKSRSIPIDGPAILVTALLTR